MSGRKINNFEDVNFGKIPPQAIDIEEVVIGAMMLEKWAVGAVMDILDSFMFYKDSHVKMFDAMKRLYQRNEPVDITTLVNELKTMGTLDMVGGAYGVVQFTQRVGSAANVEYHALIVKDKYMKRELIRVGGECVMDGFDDTANIHDSIDKAEISVRKITGTLIKKTLVHVSSPANDVFEDYIKAKNNPKDSPGVYMRIPGYDNLVGKMKPGWLVVWGARPAMGKTLTMVHAAKESAKNGDDGLVFSLEMTTKELTQRLISSEADISTYDVSMGKLSLEEENRFSAARDLVNGLPLFFEDQVYDIHRIKNVARKHKASNPNLKVIFVDYLQKITGQDPDNKSSNRDTLIGYYCRELKSLAKELDVVVVVLCQVGRSSEKRGGTIDKLMAQMSDLRESGNIEAEADLIMFPFRPVYYEITHDEQGNDISDDIWFDIAKFRHGPTGTERAKCNIRTQRILTPIQAASPIKPYEGERYFDNFHSDNPF